MQSKSLLLVVPNFVFWQLPKSRLDVMMQEYKAEAYKAMQRQIEAHNLPLFLPYAPIRLPDRIHQDVNASVWEGPLGHLYRSRVRQSSETGGELNDPILVEDDVDVVRLTCLAYRPRHGGYSL